MSITIFTLPSSHFVGRVAHFNPAIFFIKKPASTEEAGLRTRLPTRAFSAGVLRNAGTINFVIASEARRSAFKL